MALSRRELVSDTVAVVSWKDVAAERAGGGIERQTIHGDRQTLVRYWYAPGAVFPSHAHPEEQMTVVLSGRITITIGDRTVTLGPGEVATIPGGVPHGATVAGDQPVETLNCMSPRRVHAPRADAEDRS
jgi:quercetin dioxygenase-like cupin family protein